MKYDIEVKTVEAVRVAYINYQGDVSKVNKVFPTVFKSIKGKVSGAPFFEYLEMNPNTQVAHVELCVPSEATPSNPNVQIKEFPAYTALCTTHFGGYDSIMYAYEALRNYATENNIILAPQFREIYIKGPGAVLKGNPANYITEIAIPVLERN